MKKLVLASLLLLSSCTKYYHIIIVNDLGSNIVIKSSGTGFITTPNPEVKDYNYYEMPSKDTLPVRSDLDDFTCTEIKDIFGNYLFIKKDNQEVIYENNLLCNVIQDIIHTQGPYKVLYTSEFISYKKKHKNRR